MISVVLPHVPINEGFDKMLDECLSSIKGQYDELILVINDGIGYGKAFNRGLKYARGDFIIGVSNDTKLLAGNLRDLCREDAVTYSEDAQWGCFFCLPRWVLEKIGGFDPRFGVAYFEDDNYLSRLRRAGIPVERVPGVRVEHKGGVTVKAISNEEELMQRNNPEFKRSEEELNQGKSLYIPL